MGLRWLLLALTAGLMLFESVGRSAEPDAQLEFFEKRIRPILVQHCYECHAADSKDLQGELRVDHRAAIRQGGATGPAVVPGKPDESRLLNAMRYESFEMPPTGQLPERVIRDFEQWIAEGAADPREGKVAVRPSVDLKTARGFWSFQPLRRPEVPQVEQSNWPVTSIDHFVLAKLEEEGIQPNPSAGSATLARRLYFDLIGLPPSPQQIRDFAGDRSDDSFQRLVDQLLASPDYGVQWGRHWLDVVRYADSSGGGRTRILHDAWRYRDFVISAFNEDLSYDDFVTEQIAGDLLKSDSISDRSRRLQATGFLVLGPTNYELQDKELLRMEVVDEQLDTIGRGMLGMTIGCARCHDHKFDPIPTADYYALAGILRSTKSLIHSNVSGFVQRELPVSEERQARLDEHATIVAGLEAELAHQRTLASPVVVKSVARSALAGVVVDDARADIDGAWTSSQHTPRFVGAGYQHDGDKNKGQMRAVYNAPLPESGRYEVRMSFAAGENRAANVPVTVRHSKGETVVTVDQTRKPPIDDLFLSLGTFQFDAEACVVIENRQTSGHVILDAVQFVPESETRHDSDLPAPDGVRAKAEIKRLEAELQQQQKLAPARPPKVMSVTEEDEPGDYHISIRGNVHNPGAEVSRGFLSVVGQVETPQIATGESGRRQLAQWLCDPENPLTSRVIVNRVWHHLMGVGLVRTTDNFGRMGEPPSHPKLLDYLASEFIRHDWSLKWLVREIVGSRTYQMASDDRPQPATVDPENRLYWRTHHRRLTAEQIHDAILHCSDGLDRRMGGPSVAAKTNSEFGYVFESNRRGVYTPVFRNRLMDLFEVFDVADPNIVVGRRVVSTRSTQALFMLNSPFVLESADRLAGQIVNQTDTSHAESTGRLYVLLLGRAPTDVEREQTQMFLHEMVSGGNSSVDAWTAVVQSLFACIDFRYVR